MEKAVKKRGILGSIFGLKCPACRQGGLFKNKSAFPLGEMMDMPHNCTHCKEDFVREPGFYFGAMYVSYGLGAGLLLPLYVILRWGFDFDFWQAIGGCILIPLFFTPYIFRLSRSLWIHIFVRYNNSL